MSENGENKTVVKEESIVRKKSTVIVVSVVAALGIGSVSIGSAYSLGFFSGSSVGESGSVLVAREQPARNPIRLCDIKPPASGFIVDLPYTHLQMLLQAKETELPDEWKDLYRQGKEQFFAQNLKDNEKLDVEKCLKIAKIHENKQNYKLTKVHFKIIDTLFESCKKLKDQQKEAQEVMEDHFKPIKNFLGSTPSLKALLDPLNAEALANFKTLNEMSLENRKIALGSDNNILFDRLLNAHVEENKEKDILSPETRALFETAISNANLLGLGKEQTDLINALLTAKSSTRDTNDDSSDSNDVEEEGEASKVQVATEKIKKRVDKIILENEELTLADFFKVLEHQKEVQFNASAKLSQETAVVATAKVTEKIERCEGKLKTAIKDALAKPDQYVKIYNLISAQKNNEKRTEMIQEVEDIIASKAIIDQSTSGSETFQKDTSQALCLALSAHNLLRGELKTLGAAAGASVAAIEGSIPCDYFFSWSSEVNFLTDWKYQDVRKFIAAIENASQKMGDEVGKSKESPDEVLKKQAAFVNALLRFLDVLHRLYTFCKDDGHENLISSAEEAVHTWNKRIKADLKLVNDLNKAGLPLDKKLVAAVLKQDLVAILTAIKKERTVDGLSNISLYAEAAAKRESISDAQKKAWNALAKFGKCCKLTLNSSLANYFTVLVTKSNLIQFQMLLGIEAFTEEMTRNKLVIDAVIELCNSVLSQYQRNASPSNDRSASVILAAERAGFFFSFSASSAQYVGKMNEVAKRAYDGLALTLKKSDLAYLKKLFKRDWYGNFDVFIITPHEILPLLAITEPPIDKEVRKNIAILYALAYGSCVMPTISKDPPVTDDAPLDNFLTESNVSYMLNSFAYEYIDTSRDPSDKKIKVVLPGWYKLWNSSITWKHTPITFSPFQCLIDEITRDMNEYAAAHNTNGNIDEEAASTKPYPLRKYRNALLSGNDSFNALNKELVNWAIKKCFPVKA